MLERDQPLVRIQPLPPGSTPLFLVDAVVVEEDTYRVLSADPLARETYEPPDGLLGDAAATLPVPPGSILVQDGSPLKFLAVVHDLSREPTLREGWVKAALIAIVQEANRRRVTSLAVPALGARQGALAAERFAVLFSDALCAVKSDQLREVWLLVAPSSCAAVHDVLSRAGLPVQIEPLESGRIQ
jgi:hypothetical protein